MSWIIGGGVFVIGVVSLFIGFILLAKEVKGTGEIDTKWGTFSGPVWFIFIALGIILMVAGWLIPF